jgi:nucleoside-diphosphate-sugar epimerase
MISISQIAMLVTILSVATSAASAYSISIITGANGFVGRHVVYSLLQKHYNNDSTLAEESAEAAAAERGGGGELIVCLVRPDKISYEESYWQAHIEEFQLLSSSKQLNLQDTACVRVLVCPYDMLDDGTSLMDALESSIKYSSSTMMDDCSLCIYHVASVFGPTLNPIQTAKDNVKSAECVVTTLDMFYKRFPYINPRVIITSSMAAVRATDQIPLNGKYYTHRDWNTISKLNEKNWGSCYQWSKAESERRVWDMVRECNDKYAIDNKNNRPIELITLCPSFVFGPPPPLPAKLKNTSTKTAVSSSYSLALINQWLQGESPVQSRLCADVRDVAMAHIAAGTMKKLPEDDADRRYIMSTERRLSSEETAKALMKGVHRAQMSDIIDTSKIMYDTKFTGGAIKIGEREVEASERLKHNLGVVCRPVEETMQDTAEALLLFRETYI